MTSSTHKQKKSKSQQTPAYQDYVLAYDKDVLLGDGVIRPVFPRFILFLYQQSPRLARYINWFLHWDTHWCIRVNRYSHKPLVALFFKVISRLGDGWFWYAMLIAVAVSFGWSAVLPLLTTTLISLTGLIIYKLLKIKTVRPRPYQVHQVIILGERPLDVFSFPSGHTLQAVLFTCILGAYYPVLLWLMMPFAILVALSRLVLGLHYPSDVLVGAMIGFGLSMLSPALFSLLSGYLSGVL